MRRLREEMRGAGVDVTLLSVGSDLRYVSGYAAHSTERLTMLVIPHEGDASLIVPELEAMRAEPVAGITVRPWGELEDPLDLVAAELDGASTAAFGDHAWARFLMGLQARTNVRFVPASPLVGRLRLHKSPAEVALLRRAAEAADRVAFRLAGMRFSGRRERELSAWIAAALMEEGCDHAEFAIVASGPNAASPHHDAGERVMQSGDTVVCDFGGSVDGYFSDTTRTFSVGSPSAEVAEAHAVLMAAQQKGVDTVGPGVACENVDGETRAVIAGAGLGEWFIHRTGHGIGMDVHEDPYLVEGNKAPLAPGMAFSVEPGIYMPGKWGMRIEDIVVCTEAGGERLNTSSRELVEVG
jgi:Xaa-Pro aminopeptidase